MDGAEGLAAAARSAVVGVHGALASAAGEPWCGGTRGQWVESVAALQEVIDVASAAQELAMARLASLEVEWAEDGTPVERHRGAGHVSVDAAGLVSGVLGCTAVHAEARVRAAVRRAADGPPGTPGHTGLGGLHAAMAAGRVDSYRAGVVAAELEEVPAQVAATVVTAVGPYLHRETGPQLRRRVRRMLARVSPDLLRQRARRARTECRLERWVSEPGVDCWHGTFPSEEAATAWAAVDALAQRYVADGVCERVDRARAKALTDLVTGNATVEVGVVVTVPADTVGLAPVPADAVGLAPVPAEPVPAVPVAPVPVEPVPAGPGPWATASSRPAPAPDDLVEVPGLRPSEPLLVPRAWLVGVTRDAAGAAAAPGASRRDRRRWAVRACHRGSGAALRDVTPDGVAGVGRAGDPGPGSHAGPDGDPVPGTDPGPYRPGRALAALVRARDGHCRFPGCHVAARFCDLDHARPWPVGPTTAENLACLCRRHHRVKQRPGWQLRLSPDATATWTDPTGGTRTTRPPDLLHPLVLPHRPGEPVHTPHRPRLDLPDGPHSALEHHLEHLLAAATTRATPTTARAPTHRGHAHPPRDSLPDHPPF